MRKEIEDCKVRECSYCNMQPHPLTIAEKTDIVFRIVLRAVLLALVLWGVLTGFGLSYGFGRYCPSSTEEANSYHVVCDIPKPQK